ncbi:hypothetical protein G4D82_07600 [Flavobacterium sp. CYK-4]|uniref:hypothetical protein n=1 Tax=Flavobacterium lotistagni TaxID=2709660 RepID=UPI001408A50C|nr:hypothetical protein [Flavobacterium lotistagni]NHM07082.1 hypothetical protein [Flavobacterium lotistagni]
MISFLRLLVVILATILMLFFYDSAKACSMYKVTANGKTMVGCNHDTWLFTPRIWFETQGLGCCFTGARFDGSHGFAPQSGMNEFGLAFSRLAAPGVVGKASLGVKAIESQTVFLKTVLHSCKTVDEAKAYIDQFDHSIFNKDVLIYIDRSGKYLVVEPYSTTIGNDPKYVLANFCPSQIEDFSEIKQERYVNGVAFLKDKIGTDIDFCRALSDTMHVCREKIGDGTLLTTIWDLNDGFVRLYFYHDYTKQQIFNLKEELAKGDHIIDVTKLFPPNAEFQKLQDFKTPLNNATMDLLLKFCLVFFFGSGLYFLIGFIRVKSPYRLFKLGLSVLDFSLMYYMFALSTEIGIYYFPAPYQHYKFGLIDIASYLPFLLLILIVPLLVFCRKLFREQVWTKISRSFLVLNNLFYLMLIVLFFYWGLYDVFH